MADVIYLMIEGGTNTDKEIDELITIIKSSLKTQFAPKKVQIIIQEPFPMLDETEPLNTNHQTSDVKRYN